MRQTRSNKRASRQLTVRQLEAARAAPFSPDVLGERYVVCLECGRLLKALGTHLIKKHGTTAEDYKETWGYSRGQALWNQVALERMSETRTLPPNAVAAFEKHGRPDKTGCTEPKRLQTLQSLREVWRKRSKQEHPHYRHDASHEKVAELMAQGLGQNEIAQALGLNPQTVYFRLRDMGVRIPKKRKVSPDEAVEAYQKYKSVQKAARHLGCTRKLLAARLGEAGIVPSQLPPRSKRPDVTPEAVAEAHASGMKWRDMAAHFKCNGPVIMRRLREAGVPLGVRPEVTAEAVLDARRQGLNIHEIGRALHCRDRLVRQYLKEAEMPSLRLERNDIQPEQVAEAYSAGASLGHLARLHECSRKLIKRRLAEAGQPLEHQPKEKRTDIPCEEVARAYYSGSTLGQLASLHQCSPGVIRRLLMEAGHQPPHRRRRERTAESSPWDPEA